MKLVRLIFLGSLLCTLGCKDGYTDDITRVDPGEDSEAPEVDINYPTGTVFIPFTETETAIEFDFEASDDIELQSLSISLDGAELATFTDFVDYRRLAEVYLSDGIEIGNHTVVVSATDLSGKTTDETLMFEVTNEYVARDGEIFYMPFEGGVYMDLISEANATQGGSPGFVTGASGQALTVDAASPSYLLFAPDASITGVTNFTISVWSKVDFVDGDMNGSIDGAIGLFSLANTGRFWGNFNLFIDNNSNPTAGARMRIQVTSGTSETWITDVNAAMGVFNAWSNHVITYNSTSKVFNYYINGALASTATATWDALAFTDSGNLVMGTLQFQTDPSQTSGATSQAWASHLTGGLDEIRIFNKALSAAEVLALYEEVN